jgi:ABC-type glycerol-3-phosphate transport system substrate-binding protein
MLNKNQVVIVGGIGLVVLVFVLMLAGIIPGLKPGEQTVVSADLTIWGLDPKAAIDPAIATFGAKYKGLTIEYREFTDEEEYRLSLLDSLAAGTGPDIFVVRNTGVLEHVNKIAPLSTQNLPLLTIRRLFPETVEDDFVMNGSVYALPASIDTLALIYNKDLMNRAAVITPPGTWDEFISLVPKLTTLDSARRVERSAAAIGGSTANINRAADILSLLMLQNGAPMVSANLRAADFAGQAGSEALSFYTQFANTGSSVYTWSAGLPNALDLMAQGRLAMLFDYSSALGELRTRNSLLNLDVAPVPQRTGTTQPVTYASYWGYTVARQSANQALAWNFIFTLTTDSTVASAYAIQTHRVPALLSLLNGYLTDEKLNVFARQALIARAWPQVDPTSVTAIFSDTISLVNENRASIAQAIGQGESQVSQLMAKRP